MSAAPPRPARPRAWPFEWQVGWRYTRAGRAGRAGAGNGFLSFISTVSVLGIALGVAALVVVLSVMNGFQKEVRDRMLAAVAHVELHAADGGALPDWAASAALAARHPSVRGAAPFVAAQALAGHDGRLAAIALRGVEPAAEAQVTPLAAAEVAAFARLAPQSWNVLLGAGLARQLGVRIGANTL